ncbi:MAG: glycosyltransferase [Ruminococcus sp.]|nr:glycosyltransferase [Ruminococcus sp.]
MSLPEYAVLMSVYYKEKPEFFRAAAESMTAQTHKPSQFVLVCDGPLTPELEGEIYRLEAGHPGLVDVVRLKENRGLAEALNEGLRYVRYDFIARMDSDDISLPERCETQLKYMLRHKADICSATVAEFENDPEVITTLKTLPKNHAQIMEYARTRNPFNHPCVMYRKQAVLKAGKYENYRYFEDYQLWVKMLTNGAKSYNVQKPLLKMRTGGGMFARRGGRAYLRYARQMERYKLKAGFCSKAEYMKRMSAFTVFSLAPVSVREKLYKSLLRKKGDQKDGH